MSVHGSAMTGHDAAWPSLPLEQWRATHDTLHMWMQIVGMTRMVLTPRLNHWWHVTLYLTARGLTTSPIPYGVRTFQVDFDLIDHRLIIAASDGGTREMRLCAGPVADFHREYLDNLDGLGIRVKLPRAPLEVDQPIPFAEDRVHTTYEPEQANRFFRVLMQADRILKRFAGRFLGKSSPSHFFWGAFDLALTRFSGRRAPQHGDTEWHVLREANSHEEFSVGFWPGSGSVAEPAFYAYERPEPRGLADMAISVPGAYYSRELADFILPWEAVRASASPDDLVLQFCQATYEAAANLAHWDHPALDRPPSEWP